MQAVCDCKYTFAAHNASMNGKHKKTLSTIFANPVSGTLLWSDIDASDLLCAAAGATTIEGDGSRVRFVCNGVIASFHRPHPAKEAKRYQVRDAREFLTKIGVVP